MNRGSSTPSAETRTGVAGPNAGDSAPAIERGDDRRPLSPDVCPGTGTAGGASVRGPPIGVDAAVERGGGAGSQEAGQGG